MGIHLRSQRAVGRMSAKCVAPSLTIGPVVGNTPSVTNWTESLDAVIVALRTTWRKTISCIWRRIKRVRNSSVRSVINLSVDWQVSNAT